MDVELGVIEGHYGRPWSWEQREQTIGFLARHGYRFHIYAPKADPFLRRRWREDYPREITDHLHRLSLRCRALGVRFGVGLSPFEVYRDFDAAARAALAKKLVALDAVGIDDLLLMFDDMRGDVSDLALSQARVVQWVAERSKARRILVCPTYYSDDPTLDRAFGQRPERYLEDLGAVLDPAIGVFWTGEEVCSREYRIGHLDRVASQLRRKPFLWDNYPVNDGPVMCQTLHLRGFSGRPGSMAPHIAGHAINPASQPVLTRIPALTLVESYKDGDGYQYAEAFWRAATEVLGESLAADVRRHLWMLQDTGLDRLEDSLPMLRAHYGAIDHAGAREILDWLNGAYRVTQETLND